MPPKPLFAVPRAAAYDDMDGRSPASVRQWGLKGGTGLTLVAFVVLYGAIVLLQRNEESASQTQHLTSRIVQGSVVANEPGTAPRVALPAGVPRSAGNASVASDQQTDQAHHRTPRIAAASRSAEEMAPSASASTSRPPLSPQSIPAQAAGPTSAPSQAIAAEVMQPPPASQSHPLNAWVHAPTPTAHPLVTRTTSTRSWKERGTLSASAYLSARGPSPTGVFDEQPPVSRHDRDRGGAGSHSLAVARAALDKNNLAAAHAALETQPSNPQAYMLRQDLASRERSRDALLNAARACVVQARWQCAWHNAGNALSIDSSSVEAKALIERSIVDSGAESTPPGPGPAPDIQEVQ